MPEAARNLRRARPWGALLGFGALGLPFLVRSARRGSPAARRALLTRLALPDAALPPLGRWKADAALLERVVEHVTAARPRTIVELGSGVSTLVIARALERAGIDARLVSLEHDAAFADETRGRLRERGLEADLRAAPLVRAPGRWPGCWYDTRDLPERIDFLLVDGPPWTVHPLVRGAAETLFERLAIGGVVMLDDAARPGERVVAARWRRRWPGFEFARYGAGKGTLVGTRLR